MKNWYENTEVKTTQNVKSSILTGPLPAVGEGRGEGG